MLQQSQSPQPCPAKPMGPCPTPTSAHPWLLRLALSQCPTCFLLLTRWDRPCMVKLLTKQQVWAIPVAPAPLPKALSLKSTLAAQLDHWNTIRCFNSLFFLHLLFQDIHVLQNATTCKCLADLTIKIASLASLLSVLAPSWIQLRLSVSVLLFKGQHETGLGNLMDAPSLPDHDLSWQLHYSGELEMSDIKERPMRLSDSFLNSWVVTKRFAVTEIRVTKTNM